MTNSRFHKLQKEPLHDKVYRELRAAIMAGRFPPGERLTVRGIAEELGVSAMPVRAAFTRLVAELVLVQNASGGVELPEMTQDHYVELLQLRALLEGKAAAMASERASERVIKNLRKLADELTAASLSGDERGYVNANKKFKFAIVEAAGSIALTDLVERLWLQVGPFMHLFQTDVRHQAEIDRHHQVVEAIAARDQETAKAELERDILDGITFLIKSTE